MTAYDALAMSHHAAPTPPDGAARSTEEASPSVDGGLALTLALFLAFAVGLTYGWMRVAAQPWHSILAVLACLTGLYAAYLLVIVIAFLVAVLVIKKAECGRRGWVGEHWPLVIWPPVVLLGLLWPLVALLSGYDAAEWLWQSLSVYGGILAILVIFFRRRH